MAGGVCSGALTLKDLVQLEKKVTVGEAIICFGEL